MRNIEDLRGAPGVLDAVDAATRRLLAVRMIDAKAHRDPHDIVALVLHHPGDNRRIHPAGHCDEDFSLILSHNYVVFLVYFLMLHEKLLPLKDYCNDKLGDKLHIKKFFSPID